MEKKKVKRFIYRGLGFPIVLKNVPMKKVFGKWAMDINFNKLQVVVLGLLLHKPTLLKSDEIRFIRKFLNMTTTEFGKILGVSHVAVLNWEKGIARISPTSDIYLRLYLLDSQEAKNDEFRKMYTTLSPASLLEHKRKLKPFAINIDEELKTA